jgi:pyridoxal phosphate enzyme (YggS family)
VQAQQQRFGESYLQEALQKIQALAGLYLEWHFIGVVQSNKTRAIAEQFDWVHSLDRAQIARRLSERRPAGMPPLNVCLEVKLSTEAGKAGVAPADLLPLAEEVASLPRLALRGLMALPAPAEDVDEQRRAFHRVREAQESLRQRGFALDTLSMGMSHDFEAAIAEGATLVRVGTAIFGPRTRLC